MSHARSTSTKPSEIEFCGIPQGYDLSKNCIDADVQINAIGYPCVKKFQLCPVGFFRPNWKPTKVPLQQNITNGCELEKYLTTNYAQYIKQVALKPSTNFCNEGYSNGCEDPDSLWLILNRVKTSLDLDCKELRTEMDCKQTRDFYQCNTVQATSANAQRLAQLLHGKPQAKNFTAHQQQPKRAPKPFKKSAR